LSKGGQRPGNRGSNRTSISRWKRRHDPVARTCALISPPHVLAGGFKDPTIRPRSPIIRMGASTNWPGRGARHHRVFVNDAGVRGLGWALRSAGRKRPRVTLAATRSPNCAFPRTGTAQVSILDRPAWDTSYGWQGLSQKVLSRLLRNPVRRATAVRSRGGDQFRQTNDDTNIGAGFEERHGGTRLRAVQELRVGGTGADAHRRCARNHPHRHDGDAPVRVTRAGFTICRAEAVRHGGNRRTARRFVV